MKKIEIYGLKIKEDITPQTNLSKLILKEAKRQAYGIKENDIVVITSKIVSKAEGRFYKLSNVKPSKKAKILSRIYKKDAREIELILQNCEGIEFIIPIKKLAEKYGYLYKSLTTKDEEIARKIIRRDPYIFMCNVNGLLLTDAGLDFSNSPPGYCTLPPQNPDETAKKIRKEIKDLTGKEVAVIITDTEWKLDKFGTMDIALGSSGIQPLSGKFASEDLYGKPKFGGIDDLTDLVSASANLLFGQTSEAVPIVIVRGLKYNKSEKGVSDMVYPKAILKKTLRELTWENIKFKLISRALNLYQK